MTEKHNGQQNEIDLAEQNRKEELLDQLADTLELVAEGSAKISDLQSCLEYFDEADLIGADAEQALTRFKEKHHVLMSEDKAFNVPKRQHPTRKYFRRAIAVVAAAVCFSTVYIAGAADEGIMTMIGRWTNETFHFGGIGKEADPEETGNDIELNIEGDYDSIESALSACKITQDVFPKWIPERFKLDSIYVRQFESKFCAVSADYLSNGSTRILTVDIQKYDNIADASAIVFEKDDSPAIEYERAGIIHYLLHNPAGDAAVWNNGDLICTIIGDLTEEEFKKAIDSIYEEE